MNKINKRIYKNNEVQYSEPVQLGLNNEPIRKSCNNPSPESVRIVENYQDFALIEHICTCGKKVYIKCQYNTAQNVDNADLEVINSEKGS